MELLLAFGLLAVGLCALAATSLDHWYTFRNLQRWERREARRNGGSKKRPVYTGMNPSDGMPQMIGWEDQAETTGGIKSTLRPGQVINVPAIHRIPPTHRPGSKPLWLGESGKPTDVDGGDNGPKAA